MARVPLIEPESRPELAELGAKIRAARRGTVLKIYKALAHSPALAESWFNHNNAVRWKTELGGRLRELVIMRVATLLEAAYVMRQHVAELAAPEGVSTDEIEALKDWRASAFFDPAERSALAYADAMTREAAVPDAVFAEVRRHFSERQTVELTVLIGTYNLQARVINALGVEPEA